MHAYRLTESYFRNTLKREIVKQINSISEVDKNYLASPAIFLGTELNPEHEKRRIEKKMQSLFGEAVESNDKAVAMNFAFHAYQILTREGLFTEEERKTIKRLLGTLVWLNERITEVYMKARGNRDPIIRERELRQNNELARIFPFKNLTEELIWQYGWNAGGHTPSIEETLENYRPSINEAFGLLDPQDKLLGDNKYARIHMLHALESSILFLLEKEDTDQVSGTVEEAKKFFDKKYSLFERFMKELKSIRFMVLLYYGIPEFEKTWDYATVEEFEQWMKDLKSGKYDNHTELFAKGVEKVRKILQRAKRNRNRIREPFKNEKIASFAKWGFRDLFLYHHKGETIELYERITKAIQERWDFINS